MWSSVHSAGGRNPCVRLMGSSDVSVVQRDTEQTVTLNKASEAKTAAKVISSPG